uniref:SCP domain-containing protein n=1 Tax=Globisporangium ultimum (strain ATCC 200006 / CBS 805.95 / DAOM BR144) TaxID=431595 RepID=K3X175_GLOUD
MQKFTSTASVFMLMASALAVATTSAFQTGSQGRVMWENNCDFYGQDTRGVRGIPDTCGDICANDASCTHWTWSNQNGGVCWLKNGKSATKTQKYGLNCGYVVSRFSAGNSPVQTTPSSNNGLNAVETQTMLNSINAYRNQNGLSTLKLDQRLNTASLSHSRDQANRCAMSHDGSNGSKAWDRMAQQGYKWTNAAENVAAGQTSVQSVMTSWWNSPGHRANILNAEVKDVGFAKAVNNGCGNYKTYWTQDFGKSK